MNLILPNHTKHPPVPIFLNILTDCNTLAGSNAAIGRTIPNFSIHHHSSATPKKTTNSIFYQPDLAKCLTCIKQTWQIDFRSWNLHGMNVQQLHHHSTPNPTLLLDDQLMRKSGPHEWRMTHEEVSACSSSPSNHWQWKDDLEHKLVLNSNTKCKGSLL